jgi:D-glycero-alpha-D-manno-heptose-7-phosphate kinase
LAVSEKRQTIIARAPLRISFGGGGTDLAAYYERFGGFVVSAAITRYCYVAAGPARDGGIHITSADYHAWEDFKPGAIPPVSEPLQLPKAAIEWFADRGLQDEGVTLFTTSEVPPGTGLGSSSAMAVALCRAIASYLGLPMTAADLASVACRLEIERLDMPIGKQDQYASAFGGINSITFTAGGVDVQPLGILPNVARALDRRLLLFSTGQSRNSAKILRQQRTDTGVKQDVTDSLHQLKGLASEMRLALLDGDLDRFGELLDVGWQHKKRLSGMVSSNDIDRSYAAAREAGALGGKITGAGGGGFLLLYAPPRKQAAVRAAMSSLGLREMTFNFDVDGAHVLAADDEGAAVTNVVSEQVLSRRRQRRNARASALEMLQRMQEVVNHAR